MFAINLCWLFPVLEYSWLILPYPVKCLPFSYWPALPPPSLPLAQLTCTFSPPHVLSPPLSSTFYPAQPKALIAASTSKVKGPSQSFSPISPAYLVFATHTPSLNKTKTTVNNQQYLPRSVIILYTVFFQLSLNNSLQQFFHTQILPKLIKLSFSSSDKERQFPLR